MRRSQRYNKQFYLDQAHISRVSAGEIVPLLIEAINPRSVVDIGCGIGTWLKVFADHGVDDYLGVDGFGGRTDLLEIEGEKFIEHDLSTRLHINRTFDLAVSLEVAEHLPEALADTFVDSLASLAPVVAFSAAVPGQGGTGHLNEQWQSYWVDLFRQRGLQAYDLVRPLVWENTAVAAHYAQNLLIFARADSIGSTNCSSIAAQPTVINLIHPRIFTRKTTHPILYGLSKFLPETLKNSITYRLRSRRLVDRA